MSTLQHARRDMPGVFAIYIMVSALQDLHRFADSLLKCSSWCTPCLEPDVSNIRDLMVQVEWDYAPTGEDLISGGLLEDNPDAVVFVEDTSSLIGRKYMKASPNACLSNYRVVL